MKHQLLALIIGLSCPFILPSCMMGTTVIDVLDQQIAWLRASLAREQARTKQLADVARALKTEIAQKGSNPQRNRQLQEVKKEIDANAAEKARLQQEIRRLENKAGNRIGG